MIEELKDIGGDAIYVSAYTKAEYKRLMDIKSDIGYCVMPIKMDNRMSQYECDPLNLNMPCSAPLNEICIAPDGNIFLCCLDWQYSKTFGNLAEKTLLEIANSSQVSEMYNNLQKGQRNFHLCERCYLVR